jgi:uncharacterized protein
MPADRLCIFARRPLPGQVKTRLLSEFTPEQAAALYEASVRDVIMHAARGRARVELWHDGGAGAGSWFRGEFPLLHVEAQADGDLGKRMSDAFERAFSAGAQRVVIVGSDSPTLPESMYETALDHLHDGDAVIGPAVDGGYYLVGLAAAAWPRARRLFEGVPWSTAAVYEVTLERAAEAGLELRVLPGWYDIDYPDDVDRARVDVPPESHLARWFATPDAARRPAR